MIKGKKRPKYTFFVESLAVVLIDIKIVDIYGKKSTRKKEKNKKKTEKENRGIHMCSVWLLHVCMLPSSVSL